MKTKTWVMSTLLSVSSLLLLSNCTKDDETTKNVALPSVTTTEVSAITQTTATCGGAVSDVDGASILARGVCWGTTANPTISNSLSADGSAIGSFTSSLTGLTASTVYYVRAYATNSNGTAYGAQVSFTTSDVEKEADKIKTVTIGTQIWMVENLNVTSYNDGTPIPNVSDATEWAGLTTGALCDYDNKESNSATYGKLYNWYAVNTGKLCPKGWHVPSTAEWKTLATTVGGSTISGSGNKNDVSGGALKEAGTTHWGDPNKGATNASGFTALPGGLRYNKGIFDGINAANGIWGSSGYNASEATCLIIPGTDTFTLIGQASKLNGYSVRCLKD